MTLTYTPAKDFLNLSYFSQLSASCTNLFPAHRKQLGTLKTHSVGGKRRKKCREAEKLRWDYTC